MQPEEKQLKFGSLSLEVRCYRKIPNKSLYLFKKKSTQNPGKQMLVVSSKELASFQLTVSIQTSAVTAHVRQVNVVS